MKLLCNIEIECRIDKNEHALYLLFAFNKGQKPDKVARDTCAVYGDDIITDKMT